MRIFVKLAIFHRRLNRFRSEYEILLHLSIFSGHQLETDWNMSDRFATLIITITIDNEALHVSFGRGLIRKRVPLAEIVRCESIRIRWWYAWVYSSETIRLA